MIQTDTQELNGAAFRVCRSDNNRMIRKTDTGELYAEAWDRLPCPYEYEETDIELPAEPAPDPNEEQPDPGN